MDTVQDGVGSHHQSQVWATSTISPSLSYHQEPLWAMGLERGDVGRPLSSVSQAGNISSSADAVKFPKKCNSAILGVVFSPLTCQITKTYEHCSDLHHALHILVEMKRRKFYSKLWMKSSSNKKHSSSTTIDSSQEQRQPSNIIHRFEIIDL